MTVTATYDDTNGRVLITANGFSSAVPNIMLERSTDQAHWTTVRGAVALTPGPPVTGGGVTGYADYEFIPCVTNYYRASAVPMGLYLSGVTGGYASTPDNAALDITGDIDLRADATLDQWVGVPNGQALIAKWTDISPTQRSYLFGIGSNGRPFVVWSTTGANLIFKEATAAVTVGPKERLVVRAFIDVDHLGIENVVTFDTSDSLDGPFTPLGNPVVTAGTTSIFSGSLPVEVGSHSGGTINVAKGVIHAAEIHNSADVIVANPDFTLQTHHTGSFADTAGRTWTINSSPTKASIETTQTGSVVPNMTDVWIKSVTRPFLNQRIEMSCGAMGANPIDLLTSGAVRRSTRPGVFPIINRTFPVASTDLALGRSWQLRLRTWTKTAWQSLDYLFASGDVIFIHTPCDCAEIEGGYVVAYDPAYTRDIRYRNRVIWEASVEQVATPGPDVAYREATWATVLAQFGSWSAVMAACPTWADVLALLPSPSEVIVP